MRRIMNGIICFASTLLICMSLLFAVCALIPQSGIRQGCLDSEAYFSANEGFPLLFEKNLGSRLDNYADAALINVIYNVDSARPLYTMIAAPYYRIEGNDIRADLHSAVVDGLAPNNEYARYWHGSQVLLRPLLTFTSVTGCRMILFVLLLALNAVLAYLLIRQRALRPLLIYIASLLVVQFWMTAFTLEYVMTFLVTAGVCIAAAVCVRRDLPAEIFRQRMTCIFIVSGAVTCFLDFLTTETISFTVPFLLVMMLHKESGRDRLSLKKTLSLLFKWGAAWLAAYAAMFLVKWILVLLVLGKEAFFGVFSSAAYRIDRSVAAPGSAASSTVFTSRLPMMLARNIGCLFPVSSQLTVTFILLTTLGILLLLGAIFYLFRGKRVDGAFIAGQLLTGCIPYLRFLALSSHAHDHYFFTYRAQIAPVMALLAVMAYSLKPSDVLGTGKKKRRRKT